MPTSPLISVIVPIYNVENYLPRCLDALVHQTIQPYEIILVNDGSLDNSGTIAKLYASRYPYFKYYEQSNRGVSVARNKGISMATGTWIAFCDPDDHYLPNYIEVVTKAICENTCDLYQVQYTEVRQDASERGFNEPLEGEVKIFHKTDILEDYQILGGCAVWRYIFKSSIIKEFDISFPEGIIISEDEVFVLRYIKHISSMLKIPQSLYLYYRYESSVTGSLWSSHNKKASDSFMAAIEIMLKEWEAPYPPSINTAISNTLSYHTYSYLQDKEYIEEVELSYIRDMKKIIEKMKEYDYHSPKAHKYLFYARNYKILRCWLSIKRTLKDWRCKLTRFK